MTNFLSDSDKRKLVIVTDPLAILEMSTGEHPRHKYLWGRGTRLYYCAHGRDELLHLEFAISDAIKFDTRETAELHVMLLCAKEPQLVGHIHVITGEEAWAQWVKDMDEFDKKLYGDQVDSFRQRGCL